MKQTLIGLFIFWSLRALLSSSEQRSSQLTCKKSASRKGRKGFTVSDRSQMIAGRVVVTGAPWREDREGGM